MSLEFLQVDDSVNVSAFMGECAESVFALGDSPAALTYHTRQGEVKIFACADSCHLVGFFQSILRQDPERFYRLAGAFDRAQPGLGSGDPGWALTRFGGQAYLSLRLANEIYVFQVPSCLRQEMIALAVAQKNYLDCSLVSTDTSTGVHQMPMQLAVDLMN
jgi:hypothetical protein